MMPRPVLLAVSLVALGLSCRYLGPATPLHGPERPQLEANGDLSDPTRAAPVPVRRCVVDCGPGTVCDEKLAECVPVKATGRPDGGPAWLP